MIARYLIILFQVSHSDFSSLYTESLATYIACYHDISYQSVTVITHLTQDNHFTLYLCSAYSLFLVRHMGAFAQLYYCLYCYH